MNIISIIFSLLMLFNIHTAVIVDADAAINMIETRTAEELVIVREVGTVVNAESGEGNADGYYISYADVDFEIEDGDTITSYFVYNPFSNYEDDIIFRYDFLN